MIHHLTFASSVSGELPPPPPRVFFGRDKLIEEIVHLAEHLTPIALIGAGGIGKTSIALTVLHDDRTNFLRRLSKVIGADVENPEDLAPLRRYLSSKEMVIVLDNAESILDPQEPGTKEIYTVVDELSQFSNICLCIYKYGEQADPINDILEKLDFHPLSITLLATVAQHNAWDTERLTREWERQRTGVLHVQHSGSLAATIELSLSPMFRELGPDARGLLGVVAFFPQGVDERNIDWLFPTISDGPSVFDAFCILSLTYRTNGFITMLASLRDHLCPKDPELSPLLCKAKESYFARLSADILPGKPGFEESRWITSEDVNVKHLLDVFTSIDKNSKSVWDACGGFMHRLFWNKPRLTILGPKVEALPDDHPSKTQCSWIFSWLFNSVGNSAERKRLLTQTLKSCREQGDNQQVTQTLCYLSDINWQLDLYEEGIQQARKGSEIFELLGNTVKQAECLISLAYVLHDDDQLDTAEEAASRAIDLLLEEGEQFQVCLGHRVLGKIYCSRGNTGRATHHFEVALGIASSLNLDKDLFWIHYALALLFFEEHRFDDSHAHIERARSHAINDAYNLGRAMGLQASLWSQQRMFEKAKFEASHAADIYEKLGAVQNLGKRREFLEWIDEEMNDPVVSDGSGDDGKLLGLVLFAVCINPPYSDWVTESE